MKNLLQLPQHKEYPSIIKCIVEIPKDTNVKYEYDPNSGLMRLDRCLISSLQYPASYGFIPNTLSEDGDPTDVLIYNTVPLHPMTLVEVKVLGALITYDTKKKDPKIIGVPLFNPNKYEDITDLDPMFLTIVEDFFRIYKKVNKKPNPIKINGWINASSAKKYLIKCKQFD